MIKNRFWRIWPWGMAAIAFTILLNGCQQGQTTSNSPQVYQAPPALAAVITAAPVHLQNTPTDTPAPPAPETNEPAQLEPEITEADQPAPEVYTPAKDYSAGLQEIIRMAQSGISEQVMLSYITNTTQVYNLTSEEIIYLNDLGLSSELMTALIEADNNPDAIALKKQAASFKPLPEDMVLKEPVPGLHDAIDKNTNPVQVPQYPPGTVAESQEGEPANVVTTTATGPVETYQPAPDQPLPEEVSDFYEPLRPYGNWYYVPEYGYCWQPTVAVVDYEWRPYANSGRWLWTSSGWYWYSDYSWGWAPFHYGRWSSHANLGWIWVPDRVWGPSWVSWRYSKYYCGWAPLPPRCTYVNGVGLFYNGFSVGVGFGFGFGYDYYTYIHLNRFYDHHPHRYYASHHHKHAIYRDSTPVNHYSHGKDNRVVNHGVGLERISRLTRREIQRVRIDQTPSTPGTYGRRERLDQSAGRLLVAAPPLREGSGQVERASFRTSSRRMGDAAPATLTSEANGSANVSTSPTSRGSALSRSALSAGSMGPSPANRSRSRSNNADATSRVNPVNANPTPANAGRISGTRSSRTRNTPNATASPLTSTPDSPTLARPQFSRNPREAAVSQKPATAITTPRGRRILTPSPESIRIETSRPTPSSRTFRVYPGSSGQSRSALGVYSPSKPSVNSSQSRSPRIVTPSAPGGNQGVSTPRFNTPSPSAPRATRSSPSSSSFNRPAGRSQSSFSPPPVSSPRRAPRSYAPAGPQRFTPSRASRPAISASPSRGPSAVRSAPRSAPRVSSPAPRSSQSSSRSSGRSTQNGRNR